MTETASLVIKVDSSSAKRASDDLNKLTGASDKGERAANKLGAAWGKALGTLVSGYVVQSAVRGYIRMADESANLAAKLKLVTGSTEAATRAQKSLFDLSQATSSDLSATTELYVKLGQSSKELAGNHELLLGITEKVSKALVISGADAASSTAVIRQFSQAMAAGALRGDEFVSVMEGAPRLAQAIAAGMGVAVGSLRKLAADGKLTSDVIIKALEDQGSVLDREFGEMPLTVARATQQVRNALMGLVSDSEKASGATTGMAESIANMARTLESPEVKSGFAAIVSGIASVTSEAVRGAALLADWFSKAKQAADLADGSTAAKDAEYDALNTRLGVIHQERKQVLANDNTFLGIKNPNGDREKQEALAALDNEAREIQREITRRINAERWAGVTATVGGGRERATSATPSTDPDKKKKSLTDEEKALQDLARAYESYNSRLQEGIALHGQQTELAKLNYEIQSGALKGISTEQAKVLREQAEWTDWMNEMADIESVWADASQERTDRMINGWNKATDELSEFAKQAARNMQDAFADFLFDPFENGVSGMLTSFAKALQRMAAEAAASKLFDALGQWGSSNKGASGWQGFVASIFSNMGKGGNKAAGGPMQAGQAYTVGDGGKPELFVPSTSGTLYPMSKGGGGGLQVIVNNNAGVKVQAREERQASGKGGRISAKS